MNKKGFTLIELITVVIIIAILVALALPQYTRLIERSQGSSAKAGLDSMRKAEGMYFAIYSQYTTVLSRLASEVPEVSKISDTSLNLDWSYTLGASDANVDFTATAVRTRGAYEDEYIWLTNDGVLGGDHPAQDNAW